MSIAIPQSIKGNGSRPRRGAPCVPPPIVCAMRVTGVWHFGLVPVRYLY
ncbi:hypothetical protein PMO31116_01975 [Pandoraea morbifera]|uniref:Uncharacterized protein n=1 Tax=Pandoraea morbifera TaxID=2508300 RepID=A0A5E4UE59_9BURK|nr:hypothetical protein PMO31116_01975 [Pandoraea morbifera]